MIAAPRTRVPAQRQLWSLIGSLLVALTSVATAETNRPVDQVISLVLEQQNELKGIPFPDVVRSATGRAVLPLAMNTETDRLLVETIGTAINRVIHRLNAPESPARKPRRINEVSGLLEEEIRRELDRIPGFSCDFARVKSGNIQRSGYPDLRLQEKRTGRVVYLDPKLYEQGSRNSTLRTFYFEPKTETSKILEDAHHLLVGIEHSGKENGKLKFLNWDIVDLSHFRVRLKAEFQGSNRDLYQRDSIVGTSRKQ